MLANSQIKGGCDCTWQSVWMICQRGVQASFVPRLWYYPKLGNLKGIWNSYGVFVKGWGESWGAPQNPVLIGISVFNEKDVVILSLPLSTLCF